MGWWILTLSLRPPRSFSRGEKKRTRWKNDSLSLSRWSKNSVTPSNFSIKHSRDAKFGREEILARVSSAPTCRFLFIRPGESPAGARLCWLRKKRKKKKEKERKEKKERTRTSIYRGKLYHLDAQLTKKKKEKERKEQIISTFKLESWKGIVSTLVLENCLSVLNNGRHLRKVGRKISFSPLPAMIYFYSNFSVPV